MLFFSRYRISDCIMYISPETQIVSLSLFASPVPFISADNFASTLPSKCIYRYGQINPLFFQRSSKRDKKTTFWYLQKSCFDVLVCERFSNSLCNSDCDPLLRRLNLVNKSLYRGHSFLMLNSA